MPSVNSVIHTFIPNLWLFQYTRTSKKLNKIIEHVDPVKCALTKKALYNPLVQRTKQNGFGTRTKRHLGSHLLLCIALLIFLCMITNMC